MQHTLYQRRIKILEGLRHGRQPVSVTKEDKSTHPGHGGIGSGKSNSDTEEEKSSTQPPHREGVSGKSRNSQKSNPWSQGIDPNPEIAEVDHPKSKPKKTKNAKTNPQRKPPTLL